MWINLCSKSSLFNFWNYLSKGIYFKEDLLNRLYSSYGKKNRYLLNAYQSLVGTFERTPIGSELKQGIVKKQGRERIVIKEGDPDVPAEAILYNLFMFAERNNIYSFTIDEIENQNYSPQKVFTISSQRTESLLKNVSRTNFFDIEYQDNSYKIKLNQKLTCLDVVRYIGGEYEVP